MPGEVAVGSWWRATKYEVKDGFIRPCQDAKFEQFDPWDDYWRGASKRTTEPPHAQLANLIRGLRFRIQGGDQGDGASTPPLTLDPEGEEELCAWCARYGLLGIYAHRVRMVTFAREWRAGEVQDMGTTYLQTAGGWVVSGHLRKLAPEDAGEGPGADWPRTSVLVQVIAPVDVGIRLEMGVGAWSGFFPEAAPVPQLLPAEDFDKDLCPRDFPPPGTLGFWKKYAEPVVTFLQFASRLTTALDELAGGQASGVGPERTLSTLAGGAAPMLIKDSQGNYQRVWASLSLLGTLALMAQEDLLGTKRLVHCQACGRLVTSSDSRTQFCSPQCRQRLQKQRQRAKSSD